MTRLQPDPGFWEGKKTTVTGGAGFLGKPTVKLLESLGAEVRTIRSREHSLIDPIQAREAIEGAEVVIHLAARVGGIGFNRNNPGPLVYENLMMGSNVFEACREFGIEKLVAACSVCAYPMSPKVPFKEEAIWDGYPEVSNAPYGLAKRMHLVLSDAYRRQYGMDSCVPVIANLYGPDDNFDLDNSHVIAAMVRKFCEASAEKRPVVTLWGSGKPSREFLYVEDAAFGLVLAAEHLQVSDPVNLGVGRETEISDLARLIADLSSFEGEIVWDASMPDGQLKRRLDVERARELIGFEATTSLEEGLARTVEWFRTRKA